jgi:hypothetical protein
LGADFCRKALKDSFSYSGNKKDGANLFTIPIHNDYKNAVGYARGLICFVFLG